MRIVILQWKPLDLAEQVFPDFDQGVLGHSYHDPLLQVSTYYTENVYACHDQYPEHKIVYLLLRSIISRYQVVDDGPQNIASSKARQAADKYAGKHEQDLVLVLPDIVKQPFHRGRCVFRFSSGHGKAHGRGTSTRAAGSPPSGSSRPSCSGTAGPHSARTGSHLYIPVPAQKDL